MWTTGRSAELGNTSREQRKRCSATRAPRYVSRAAAEEVILNGKIKSAINGGARDAAREPEVCESCGGWHIITRSRRERRAET